jgi:hypothetical protein
MKYSEKLRDPRWQKKRLEIMQRDCFACRNCRDKESTLNVHHQWYKRGAEPWDYDADSLVTLCESCHADEPAERERVEEDLLLILRQCGLTSDDLNNLCEALIGRLPQARLPYDLSALVFSVLAIESCFHAADHSMTVYDAIANGFGEDQEKKDGTS